MWAIFGGSGFEKFEGFETLEELDEQTPFGNTSSGFKKIKVHGHEALFISRHGAQHELSPSEVNYRANVFAAKKHGASGIISVSAVGSLDKNLKPGDMVIPSQYIDRTKGVRAHTFCGEGLVGHVSLAEPVHREMLQKAFEVCQKVDWVKEDNLHCDKTYICIEGPYFSTRSESLMYQKWGADIIGMTNFPEYALAREAGLDYLPCSFVTDFDCFDPEIPHVTVEEVIRIMSENNKKAFAILKSLLDHGNELLNMTETSEQGLKAGLMTPKERWPVSSREFLEVLLN